MSQPAATTPPRLLTPNMQNEVDALVFRPRRLPAAAPSPSPSARAPLAVPNDQVAYVRQPRTHAGADTAAPHMRGYATVMADGNDTSLPFDKVYSERYVHKDTEDHFGEGMVMAATEHEFHGMDLPFDSVYSQAHVDKDTEDHFGSGLMTLEKDEDALARERFLAARQQQYAAAREKLIAEMPKEAAHMGHEQGDAESHFLPGEMNLSEKVSTMLPFDRVYDSRFDGKSASGHFDDGMQLGSKATAGNSFDLVYGAEHEGRVAESHFVPGTMHTEPTSKSLGLPGQSAPKITRYPPLTREQMIPPHRPKFLRGTCGEAGKPPQLSAEMQKHVDSVTFRPAASPPRSPAALLRPATVGGGAPASVGGGPGGASCASSSLQGGRTAPGSGGHASGAGTGRVEQLPSSQKKFAWNSERIAHELVIKFDQFTRRREDHMQKLLWTFGADPCFESQGAHSNAIQVSPSNFNRVCDRFGLVCNEKEATEIFEGHGLPTDGCNLYTLASKFLTTNDDSLARKQQRLPPRAAPPTPVKRSNPFRLAKLTEDAWREHAYGAAAAPFAVTLPPITASGPSPAPASARSAPPAAS